MIGGVTVRAAITDLKGRTVELTEERWGHIVELRKEINAMTITIGSSTFDNILYTSTSTCSTCMSAIRPPLWTSTSRPRVTRCASTLRGGSSA